MEMQSTSVYWHMKDDSVYDYKFVELNRMTGAVLHYISCVVLCHNTSVYIGNMGGTDVTATTWFGSKLGYVHGINM